MRGGFSHAFGRDPGWWLTLVLVLLTLFVLELGLKVARRTLAVWGLWRWWAGRGCGWAAIWRRGARRDDRMDGNLEDWDLGLWQEMEKDPGVRARLAEILEEEERGGWAVVDDDLGVQQLVGVARI